MRVSLNWLRQYVDINVPVEELAERLTMAGLAVEGIERLGEEITKVVVGRITEVASVPETDKLRVARVEVGAGKVLTVVSGAPNIAVGAKVPVALPGATLPGGVQIVETVIGGINSQGMLCSEDELGLAAESDGVMILPADAPLGQDIVEYLGLRDVVFEMDLTANRPDCHSMLGIAREVAAILATEVRYPTITYPEAATHTTEKLQVEVVDQDLCPRYMAKVITGVKVGPSPLWLKRYLLSAGMRPINNVVDITNFVLLEQNQPLHAFDYDKLIGRKLVIRRAKPGEKIVTLDETERVLSESMLVIADAARPVCIAGVMGGANSEVDEQTTTIALEAAWFDQVSIRRTSRSLGLRSEASARFERGLNPENTAVALNRAAQLMVELCGATALAGEIDVYPHPEQPVVLELSLQQVNGLLGTELAAAEVCELLGRLPEFELEQLGEESWRVFVPSYRRDISVPADLIEEIARLYGYDTIPSTLPAAPEVVGLLTPAQQRVEKVRSTMVSAGFSEIVTYSLANELSYERLGLAERLERKLDLVVPLNDQLRFMRTSMLPSLVDTLIFNLNRGHKDLALFEIGRIYLANPEGLPTEERVLAVGMMGNAVAQAWHTTPRPCDFYDLKGVIEVVLEALGVNDVRYQPGGEVAPYHPWRNARILWSGACIGSFGELHPKYVKEYGFTGPVVIGELNLETLLNYAPAKVTFQKLPKYPASRKDLALVLDKAVPSAEVKEAIRELAGEFLESVEVFDQYEGAQVGAGKKSLAFSLLLRHPERTLTEEEISALLGRVADGLEQRFAAQLRG